MDCERVVNPRGLPLDPVRNTLEAWKKSVRAGDLDALVELVSDDAEFWTPGQPALRGREAVRQAFGSLLEQWEIEQSFECHEIILAEDLALLRGTEVNRLKPLDGGEPLVRRQRAFSVLRKDDDGVWRFARGMTHSPPESEG